MSLSTTHSSGVYEDVLFRLLKYTENTALARDEATDSKYIHNGGGDGNPTIGYGYNLAAHSAAQNAAVLKVAMGYTADTPVGSLPQDIQDALQILGDWKAGTYTNQQIIDMAAGSYGTSAQQQAIRSLEMNDVRATALLDATINGLQDSLSAQILSDREDALDDYLNGDNAHSIDISAGSSSTVDDSNERAALMSLYYNNPALIGPGLLSALRDDKREEAWYEIRYRSNGDHLNGIASRRYYESEVFGLFADPNSLTKADALKAFEMFTHHERVILGYEDTYGGVISTANSQYQLTGADQIGTRAEEFEPARTYLAAMYLAFDEGHIDMGEAGADVGLPIWGEGETSLRSELEAVQAALVAKELDTNGVDQLLNMQGQLSEIYVAGADTFAGEVDAYTVDRPSLESLAGVTNDLIFGSDSADTLLAGSGDDALVGSAGADSLSGGNGIDLVIYADSDSAVSVDLDAGTGSGGHAADDTLSSIENVIGSAYDDTLSGNSGDNILVGLTGNDQLEGGDGNDLLLGGEGDDTLFGGAGSDALSGGAGNDLFMFGGEVSEWVNPSVIIDGEIGDRVAIGEVTLSGGTADAYYLDSNDETWKPIPTEEMMWFGGDGNSIYRMIDGDLWIFVTNENDIVEAVVVPGWQDGDVGLHLDTVDNRFLDEDFAVPQGDMVAGAPESPAAILAVDLFPDAYAIASNDNGAAHFDQSAPSFQSLTPIASEVSQDWRLRRSSVEMEARWRWNEWSDLTGSTGITVSDAALEAFKVA